MGTEFQFGKMRKFWNPPPNVILWQSPTLSVWVAYGLI